MELIYQQDELVSGERAFYQRYELLSGIGSCSTQGDGLLSEVDRCSTREMSLLSKIGAPPSER
jgi:hypothetical protein